MKLYFETQIDKNFLVIKESFNRKLFLSLTPPGVSLNLKRFDGCAPGDEIHLELNSLGLKQQWVSLITTEKQDEKEWSFVDEGKLLPWPLTYWKHHHRVVYLDDNSSKIIDDITYNCGFRGVDWLISPVLWSLFAIRPGRYKKFFQGL